MSEQSRRDLAQLLLPVIRWTPERGFAEARPLIDQALALGVGGFQLVGGEQDSVRALAKELQLKSRHPLLIAAELERGAGQQFASATGLPPLAAITALGDIESLRRAARLTAREARTMGVNWNLGPVCDLDMLTENPLIGSRALGNDARKVGQLVTAWIEACQAEGVLACAKHFPGIARVTTDPHRELPVVDTPADQLKELDLHPFRAAISGGVASMMTAHVSYPALDSSREPATLSREMLQWLLRQQLKFDNLLVSDALTLAAVTATRTPAEAAVLALRAGCDVLLDPGELEAALSALETALDDGTLDPERVRQSVRRRLKWAQWASPPNDWRRPSGADTAWGALLADKVLRLEHEPIPPMGVVTEMAIVDDDDDVIGRRADRTGIVDAMRLAGNDARIVSAPTPASGGPFVIALFADYLPGKGRHTLRDDTVAAVKSLIEQAEALQRTVVLVGLGDPRWVTQLGMTHPTILAWSGDRVMQQAAGRGLLRTKR
ncbi:MAG TPA: glycoside hydrolase family 3 N-terminal domain-containing protein [Gemmatimonas sp.]|uniref:glycoside hydrolase family 3 protein n=1 Tax=Gemmatimonas sp. TaxID=1962908 RepID=UPI002ED97898